MRTNKGKYVLWLLLSKCIPILHNAVFFDSFNGQYNDNPKYISEKLHDIEPGIKIYWCISEKGRDLPPEYVNTVKCGSIAYYYLAFNASVVIDNNVGIKTFGFKRDKNKILEFLVQKKGQLCISTWHGTPIKRVGKDQIKRESNCYITSTDYLISGSEYNSKTLANAFYIKPEDILSIGMPRTDILFQNIERETMLEKLGLPINKKIVLFAPTFRESAYESGIRQLKELNIDRLLKTLSERFEEEFVFVFRVHHTVLMALEGEIKNTKSVYNGNEHDDMAEYLSVSDVLITDYSGSMFDFAITGKPCFLFAPDFDHYSMIERGLYIDYKTLPFPISYYADELYQKISGFNLRIYNEQVHRWLKVIGNCEDGEASYKASKMIIEHIKKNR